MPGSRRCMVRVAAAVVGVTLLLGACSDDDPSDESRDPGSTSTGESATTDGDTTTSSAGSSAGPATASELCVSADPVEPSPLVESGDLIEISGLATSRANPGILWAHNDSGG